MDSKGQVWEADRAYSTGAWGCMDLSRTDILSTRDPISGTQDPILFQTMRVGESFRYRFDLSPGEFLVRILMAEIYWESSDAERQDIYLNGRRVVRSTNIFDDVGHDAALVESHRVWSEDGIVEIKFTGRSLPMHSGARACAIEVIGVE